MKRKNMRRRGPRLLSILLTLCMVLCLLPGTALAMEDNNSNDVGFVVPVTPVTEVPYGYTGIYTAQDMDNIRDDLENNYILMADIDLQDLENDWIPIDNFSGVLDGNGHSITNLYINVDETTEFAYIGLFGFFKGTIKNLCLSNGSIITDYSKTGGIVGSIAAYVRSGRVENCLSKVDVQGSDVGVVGGIIGRLDGYADNIKNLGNISVEVRGGCIGGVIGEASTLAWGKSNLYNYGTVYVKNTGTSLSNPYTYVGGIIGASCGKLSNCYNYGNVSAYSVLEVYAGGIVGTLVKAPYTWGRGGEISDSRNAGDIFAGISGIASSAGYNNLAYAGGISADMDAEDNSTIHRCFNTGNVTAKSIQEWDFSSYETKAHGIGSGIISDCYNTGEVIASRISGSEYSSFPNARAYTAAAGISCGGKSIINCYNIGAVTAE